MNLVPDYPGFHWTIDGALIKQAKDHGVYFVLGELEHSIREVLRMAEDQGIDLDTVEFRFNGDLASNNAPKGAA